MEVSFEELRKIHLHEKRFGSLAALSDDFYSSCRMLLDKQKADLCREFSLESARSYENFLRLLREVVELRQSKILLKSLRDLRAGTVSGDGLAAEEKGLYTSAVRLLKEYEDSLVEAPRKPEELKEACEVSLNPVLSSVRILLDIPEPFVGADGREYGPFSAGQVVELSSDQAALLVKRNAAALASSPERDEARSRVAVLTEGRVEEAGAQK